MSPEHPVQSWKRPAVTTPLASEELADLSLAELRSYRDALSAEEDKTSYWRRLVFARIDLLEAQADSVEPLTPEDLVRVLGDTGSGRSRRALLRIQGPLGLPDLPDLAELRQLWSAEPSGAENLPDLVARLQDVGAQLSEYRGALHDRIDAATGALILRYRLEPQAALSLLPKA